MSAPKRTNFTQEPARSKDRCRYLGIAAVRNDPRQWQSARIPPHGQGEIGDEQRQRRAWKSPYENGSGSWFLAQRKTNRKGHDELEAERYQTTPIRLPAPDP
jgi:hypothetical protein